MTEVEISGAPADADPRDRVGVDRPAPHTLLLTVRGDLDDPALAHLNAVLDEELEPDGEPSRPRYSRVVLDLSRVTLLPAPAVELLGLLRRRCRAGGGHLVLVGTGRPAVHRPLRTSGLLPLFDTRPTLRSAVPEPPQTRRSPARTAP